MHNQTEVNKADDNHTAEQNKGDPQSLGSLSLTERLTLALRRDWSS